MPEEISADPPRLLTAGWELHAAGRQFNELGEYAENHPAAAVRAGARGTPEAPAAFEEAWADYTRAMVNLAQLIAATGTAIQRAAVDYDDTDAANSALFPREQP